MIFYDDYVLKYYKLLLINHVHYDMLFTMNIITLTNFCLRKFIIMVRHDVPYYFSTVKNIIITIIYDEYVLIILIFIVNKIMYMIHVMNYSS